MGNDINRSHVSFSAQFFLRFKFELPRLLLATTKMINVKKDLQDLSINCFKCFPIYHKASEGALKQRRRRENESISE